VTGALSLNKSPPKKKEEERSEKRVVAYRKRGHHEINLFSSLSVLSLLFAAH
jgi:hypothetical protein